MKGTPTLQSSTVGKKAIPHAEVHKIAWPFRNLTCWDQGKMTRWHFQMHFLEFKRFNFKYNSIESWPFGFEWSVIIDSGNSFALNKRHASIWTNDDLNYWCIYASLGHYELRRWGWLWYRLQFSMGCVFALDWACLLLEKNKGNDGIHRPFFYHALKNIWYSHRARQHTLAPILTQTIRD